MRHFIILEKITYENFHLNFTIEFFVLIRLIQTADIFRKNQPYPCKIFDQKWKLSNHAICACLKLNCFRFNMQVFGLIVSKKSSVKNQTAQIRVKMWTKVLFFRIWGVQCESSCISHLFPGENDVKLIFYALSSSENCWLLRSP